MLDAGAYFAKQAEAADGAQNTELAQMWQMLQEHYQKRLWHQLTLLLIDLIVRPELKDGGQLHDLYTNAIADFETK